MVQPYVGEIRMFGGTFAPAGWMLCNGQILSISAYETLYSLIGTTYGGNGTSTFGLPDLQGRIPLGQGQGTGLSPRILGQPGGQETVTLTTQMIPGHSHPFNVSPSKASVTTISGNLPGAVIGGLTGELYTVVTPPPNPPAIAGTLMATSVGPAGGSQPHDNIMPSLCVTFIIAMFGVYPQFN
jgi:microcystin-dependent protein